MITLTENQKNFVNELIDAETTFLHGDRKALADNGLIYGGINAGKKVCTFELIAQKPKTEKYDLNKLVLENTPLFEDLIDIVVDYAVDDDMLISSQKRMCTTDEGNRHFVDTTLIVVNTHMELRNWKEIYNTTFKKRLKAKFITNKKQLEKLTKNYYSLAKRYDAVVITQPMWNKLFLHYKYAGYHEYVQFVWNRVVFGKHDLFNISHCPEANFTWCFTNRKESHRDAKFELNYLPHTDRKTCWNYSYRDYKEHRRTFTRCLVNNDTFDVSYRFIRDNRQNSQPRVLTDFIQDIEMDIERKFLFVIDRDEKVTSTRYCDNYEYIRVSDNQRFNKGKFLDNMYYYLFATPEQLQTRSDLSLDFITDIIWVHNQRNHDIEFKHTEFDKCIERCITYDRDPSLDLNVYVIADRSLCHLNANYRKDLQDMSDCNMLVN